MKERETDQEIKDRQDSELEAEREERRERLGHNSESLRKVQPEPAPEAPNVNA